MPGKFFGSSAVGKLVRDALILEPDFSNKWGGLANTRQVNDEIVGQAPEIVGNHLAAAAAFRAQLVPSLSPGESANLLLKLVTFSNMAQLEFQEYIRVRFPDCWERLDLDRHGNIIKKPARKGAPAEPHAVQRAAVHAHA